MLVRSPALFEMRKNGGSRNSFKLNNYWNIKWILIRTRRAYNDKNASLLTEGSNTYYIFKVNHLKRVDSRIIIIVIMFIYAKNAEHKCSERWPCNSTKSFCWFLPFNYIERNAQLALYTSIFNLSGIEYLSDTLFLLALKQLSQRNNRIRYYLTDYLASI